MTDLPGNRELALERELEQLVRINGIVSKMIKSIRRTSVNVANTNEATNNTKILLNQWIRILSQAHFTNEIINDKSWDGKNVNVSEEDIEQKLKVERELSEELNILNSETDAIKRKIDNKENEKASSEARVRDFSSKRRNELGLNTERANGKRIRSGIYR